MRILVVVGGVGLALAGCSAPPSSTGSTAHGRYIGIGTYAAGELWSRMVIANPTKGISAATTRDDEHVIVVVDSQTGEVRECGDYTGLCVSMNPWTKPIATPQIAPVTLTKHLADIVGQQKAAAR